MQHLEGSGRPVLYIGRTVLKGYIRIHNIAANLRWGKRVETAGVGLDRRLILNGGSTAQNYCSKKVFAVRTLHIVCKFVAQNKTNFKRLNSVLNC